MNSSTLGSSRWIKCISLGGNVRGVAIQGTNLCREIVKMHDQRGSAAKGLSEAILGSLLIASYCKGEERVNLNIRGSGPYAQTLVDAYPNGLVRGFLVTRPQEEAYQGENSGPWGEGLLSVLRTKIENEANGSRGTPYIGTVPLVTGHLAKDLTFYWHQSEQIPTAIGIVVKMKDDAIESAGAFLVQILPGANELEVETVDKNVHHLHSFTERFMNDESPVQILSEIFQDSSFTILEEREVGFSCQCSQERVERSLLLLGTTELESMKNSEIGYVEVGCDFCSKKYQFNDSEISSLIQKLRQ